MFVFEWTVRILVSISTKNKYRILKYISSLLVLDDQINIVAWVYITLLTKEIKPKNNFYRNEVQYRDDVPTKRKVGM